MPTSLNDILKAIGANEGETIDFIGLGEILGLNPNAPMTLPDDYTDSNGNPKTISLTTQNATASPTSLSFNNVGGVRSLSITATGIYRISSYPDWISVDRAFSKGSRVFSIIASPNNNLNDSERDGNIIFLGSGNSQILSVPVDQPGSSLVATISPTGNQTLSQSAGYTNIIVRLSTDLSVSGIILSNEDDFSIALYTTSTSGGVTTRTYRLTRSLNDTNSTKQTTVTVGYQGEGATDTFPPITFTQDAFQPSISVNPAELEYAYSGGKLSYTVTSTSNFKATISGDGYSHSTSQNGTYSTNQITGTSAGRTIWVKATGHTGSFPREGEATVTTTFGVNDVSATVDLNQVAAPTYSNTNINITGYSVNSDGVISLQSVTATGVADEDITITFSGNVSQSKGYNPSLTAQTRSITASVTVPAGYANTGQTVSKTIEDEQEAAVLSGNLYYPYNGSTFSGWEPGGSGGTYENLNFWAAAETATAYLSFSLVTNVPVNYSVSEVGSYTQIVQPTTDTSLSSFTTSTAQPSSPHFRVKANAPSAGSSYTFSLQFTTTAVTGKNFSVDITLGRTASNPTVSNNNVETIKVLNPTVNIIQQ